MSADNDWYKLAAQCYEQRAMAVSLLRSVLACTSGSQDHSWYAARSWLDSPQLNDDSIVHKARDEARVEALKEVVGILKGRSRNPTSVFPSIALADAANHVQLLVDRK